PPESVHVVHHVLFEGSIGKVPGIHLAGYLQLVVQACFQVVVVVDAHDVDDQRFHHKDRQQYDQYGTESYPAPDTKTHPGSSPGPVICHTTCSRIPIRFRYTWALKGCLLSSP